MMVPDYVGCQELARNEWFLLCRGRHREDGKPVLLKTPCHDPASPFALRLLEHEYATLQRLSVPGVIRVHELLRYDRGCCLVLEDAGGTPLQALHPWRPRDLDALFKLAIQLATILSELHRQGVTHKHLNPWSILLHPTTNEVYLADFSLASWTVSETPTSLSLSLMPSTLAYLSPEQTGRMNRVVDYRTDFYSLGVTFYELLTGSRPFRSDDPLELIHSHIAKRPMPPSEIGASIPEPLSRIVMKLLAKTAEERYQSAIGLRADFEHCARQWTDRGEITPFPLGQQDMSDRFVVPQYLYGREQQLDALLGVFEQTCQGRSACVLVAGYAGIGKTTLIQELYKPLVRQRGYFIAGKFDQLARNIPYYALIQAFQQLVQRLLAEGEERLHVWRAQLTEALGVNSGVLAEVLPEIELILGIQPPVPALGPTEAQNRFIMVLQNFLSVLATPEHPLVVFLDDLQWVDAATLSLLPPLLTNPNLRCLCLIGAYHDNEVSTDHPLRKAQAALAEAGAQLYHISLPPLGLEDLTDMVQEALHNDLAEARPLAELLKRKTDGNPFFVIQFLKTLHQEGFITFDYDRRRWTYDMAAAAERLALAQLNLTAGRRAKSSTAYQAALTYFQVGIGLLTEAHWDCDYGLLFALHQEAAECDYLGGHFVEAEGALDWLLGRARTRLDKAKIYALKVLQYEHMSRYPEAIRTGREGLALFGLCFPDLPEEKQALWTPSSQLSRAFRGRVPLMR
jgi:AAA ATPase domain/Protein kinase domain